MPVIVVGNHPVQHGLGRGDQLNKALEEGQRNYLKEADLQGVQSAK